MRHDHDLGTQGGRAEMGCNSGWLVSCCLGLPPGDQAGPLRWRRASAGAEAVLRHVSVTRVICPLPATGMGTTGMGPSTLRLALAAREHNCYSLCHTADIVLQRFCKHSATLLHPGRGMIMSTTGKAWPC